MVSGTEQKNSTSPFLLWMSQKATKGLSAEIEPRSDGDSLTTCEPETSAVFLIAK
jgi:hypothetical protein